MNENQPSVVLPEPGYQRPPEEVVAGMRRHRENHGERFHLRRDVAWPGNKPKNAAIDLELASPFRPARYWCIDCPGGYYEVGEPEYGPERASWVRRRHPEAQAFLRGAPPERLDELTAAWDRGELGVAAAEAAIRAERQKPRRLRDLAAEERRRGCQAWMLRRYAEIGNVSAVIEELETLLQDPQQCREITGGIRPLGEERLKKLWGGKDGIPLEKRRAAERDWEARPEAERREIEKARRLDKLTP